MHGIYHASKPPVLDLLISDTSNPRSLAYQLERLDDHFASIETKRSLDAQALSPAQKALLPLNTALQLFNAVHAAGNQPDLFNFLETTVSQLEATATAIDLAYFSHALPARSIEPMPWRPDSTAEIE